MAPSRTRTLPVYPNRPQTTPDAAGRKPWRAPFLRRLGDLRGLTLGPSPGLGESANPSTFRVPVTD